MNTKQLTNWAQAIRSIPALADLSVRDVAAAVEPEIRATIAEGADPSGAAWPVTELGTAPLQHANDATVVEVRGNVVLTSVRGHNALHHLDRNGAPPQRRIIPRGLTPRLVAAAERAAAQRFLTEVRRGG